MADESESKSHFGTIIGAVFAVLIITMLLTMTLVAAKVGALSKPGVEMGIGRASSPLPSPNSPSASMTTC